MLHFLCSLVDSYKVRMIATYPKNPNCHKSYVYLTQIFILDSQSPKKKKTNSVCGTIGQYVSGDSHSMEYCLAAHSITGI